MKAAIFKGSGRIDIEDINRPVIGPEEVLVKVKYTGICGTDWHIVKGEAPAATPVIPGHEISGIIVECGSNVDLKINDRVAIDPNIFCGKCTFCHNGQVNLCQNLAAVGVTQDGGFAEYVKAPAANVYKLPDSLSYQEGSMVEPVSCCLHGIDIAGVDTGEVVSVLGGGAIGLILAQLARTTGAGEVIISEPDGYKRKIAEKLGFKVYNPFNTDLEEKVREVSPEGADIVIEAAGTAQTVEESLKLVKKGGTILFFGVCPEDIKVPLSPFAIYKKELTIRGSYINPFVTERAIDLLAGDSLDVKSLITDVYSLSDLPQILIEGQNKANSIKSLIEIK